MDYKEECKSFIEFLQSHGWDVTETNLDDDINYPETVDEIVEDMLACDDCNVWFKKENCVVNTYIVLGNGPGELLCDYAFRRVKQFPEDLKKEFDDITYQWSLSREEIKI